MNKQNIICKFAVACSIAISLVPMVTKAENYGETFKKYVKEEGKIVINAPAPRDLDEAYYIIGEYPYNENSQLYFSDCNDTFTRCTFSDAMDKETHVLDIEYKYDKEISKQVDEIVDKIPKNVEYFNIKDFEIINYWLNKVSNEEGLDEYSGELKKYLNYNNIEFSVSNRTGSYSDFHDYRAGIGMFKYKGNLYRVNTLGTMIKNILYVPSSTENTADAKINALKKRIKEYANVDVEIEVKGKISEWLNSYIQKALDSEKKYNPNDQKLNQMTIEEYYNSDYFEYDKKFIDFLENYKNDNYFTIKINNATYNIVIVADSDKMITPGHKSKDLETNITVEVKNSSIPLDVIVSSKLVSNDRIKEKINTENYVTYDISLFSKSKNSKIQTLGNDLFEVSIPIPESLKGKKLVVYYEKEDGTLEEHEVVIKDDYAVFETSHFSEYTLAEKISNEKNTDVPKNEIENPKTGDNLAKYILMSIISLCGIISLSIKKVIR